MLFSKELIITEFKNFYNNYVQLKASKVSEKIQKKRIFKSQITETKILSLKLLDLL
jgi:hypothetical protein